MDDILDFQYLDRGKDALCHRHHSHGQSYEFILVLSGSGLFLVGDRAFEIKAEHLYLIDGMSAHCSAPDAKKEYVRRKLVLCGEVMERVLQAARVPSLLTELFRDGGCCISLSGAALDTVNAAFSEIAKAINENGPLASLRTVKAVIDILLSAKDGAGMGQLHSDADIAAILAYVSRHFQSPLSLDEISGETHISKYYLCRRFKECVGVTVFDYILSMRLSHAKKQLAYSDAPISQIAINAGFSDFAYFSRVFRKREGIPPKKYRLLHRK